MEGIKFKTIRKIYFRLLRATEDSTIKEHTSLIKVLIISFIGSIFIMIFLVFIIEFFKKVDWQNLKRELK
jgi:hypothetical protein